jgi:hypothetical protein
MASDSSRARYGGAFCSPYMVISWLNAPDRLRKNHKVLPAGVASCCTVALHRKAAAAALECVAAEWPQRRPGDARSAGNYTPVGG